MRKKKVLEREREKSRKILEINRERVRKTWSKWEREKSGRDKERRRERDSVRKLKVGKEQSYTIKI